MLSAAFLAGSIYALGASKHPEILGLMVSSQVASAKELTSPLPDRAPAVADKAQQKVLDRFDQHTQAAGRIIVDGLKKGLSQAEISATAAPDISAAVTSLDRAVRTCEMYGRLRGIEAEKAQDQPLMIKGMELELTPRMHTRERGLSFER